MSFSVHIERLTGKGIVTVAAKHNLREIADEGVVSERIDPKRRHQNYILRGPDTAKGVATLRDYLLKQAKVPKLRVDAVQALEILFTWPFPKSKCPAQYFEDCTQWAVEHFKVPILSSVVHLDESQPHCHVLLLPLLNGRMNGSDLFGKASRLSMHLDSFYSNVGAKFGIARPVPRPKLGATTRNAAIAQMRLILKAVSDLSDSAIDVILEPHRKSPHALIDYFKIVLPGRLASKANSFVEIMTKRVKPDKPRFDGPNLAFD